MEDSKKISHERFSALLDRISNNGFKNDDWFPTMAEAAEIAREPLENYEFILWIVESSPDRKLSEEQKEVESFLQKVLMEHTEFIP